MEIVHFGLRLPASMGLSLNKPEASAQPCLYFFSNIFSNMEPCSCSLEGARCNPIQRRARLGQHSWFGLALCLPCMPTCCVAHFLQVHLMPVASPWLPPQPARCNSMWNE